MSNTRRYMSILLQQTRPLCLLFPASVKCFKEKSNLTDHMKNNPYVKFYIPPKLFVFNCEKYLSCWDDSILVWDSFSVLSGWNRSSKVAVSQSSMVTLPSDWILYKRCRCIEYQIQSNDVLSSIHSASCCFSEGTIFLVINHI